MVAVVVFTETEIRCGCGHGIIWGTDEAINDRAHHCLKCPFLARWYVQQGRSVLHYQWETHHHVWVYGACAEEIVKPRL